MYLGYKIIGSFSKIKKDDSRTVFDREKLVRSIHISCRKRPVNADQIVANPATLTGSIGVIVGKFVVKDMLDKIGVNVAEFNYGDNAAMWSSTSAFDEKEKQNRNETNTTNKTKTKLKQN